MLISKCNYAHADVFPAQPCASPVPGTAVLSQQACSTCWCCNLSISATMWQNGRHNLHCGEKMSRVIRVASLSTQGSTHVASGRTGLNSWPWENLQIDTPLPSLTWFSLGLTPCHSAQLVQHCWVSTRNAFPQPCWWAVWDCEHLWTLNCPWVTQTYCNSEMFVFNR